MTAIGEGKGRPANPGTEPHSASDDACEHAHVYVLPPTRFEKFKRLILFILFLGLLALILKSMGWCIGGVCLIGMDSLGL